MTVRQEDAYRPPRRVERRVRPTGFRPDIEGLRAVAVIAVVLYHAGMPGTGRRLHRRRRLLRHLRLPHHRTALARGRRRQIPFGSAVFYGARAAAYYRPRPLSPSRPRSARPSCCRPYRHEASSSTASRAPCTSATTGSRCRAPTTWPPTSRRHRSSTTGHSALRSSSTCVWPVLIIGTAWLVRRRTRRTAHHGHRMCWSLGWSGRLHWRRRALDRHVGALGVFLTARPAWELAAGGLVALSIRQWRRLPPLPARSSDGEG